MTGKGHRYRRFLCGCRSFGSQGEYNNATQRHSTLSRVLPDTIDKSVLLCFFRAEGPAAVTDAPTQLGRIHG
jgi:hypothetical protein